MKRHPLNPILSAKDIPFPSSLVFNAGACKWQGRYLMLFRNDYGSTEGQWRSAAAAGEPHPVFSTNIGIATSADGVHWEVGPRPVFQMRDDEIGRVYDPRLSIVEGRPVLCFAMDTKHGLRGGIAAELRALLLRQRGQLHVPHLGLSPPSAAPSGQNRRNVWYNMFLEFLSNIFNLIATFQ